MNQSNHSLKLAHNFIQFLWGISLFIAFALIMNILSRPYDVRPPVNFKVSEAGEVIQNQTHTFSINHAHGHVNYQEGYQPSLTTMLVYHGTEIVEFLLGLFILFQIKTMTNQALTGNTFNVRNSQRLQWIGWTILVLGVLKYAENIYSHYHFDGTLFLEPITDRRDKSSAYRSGYVLGRIYAFLRSPFLLAGLSALILSLIFQEGTTLKKEVDLTI